MRVPSPHERKPEPPSVCEIDGCEELGCPTYPRLCIKHYLEGVKKFEEESSKVNIRIGLCSA